LQEICKKDTIKDKECDDFSLLEQKQELQVAVKQNNQRTGRMSMEEKKVPGLRWACCKWQM